MEIELKVGGQKLHSVGTFHYNHYTNNHECASIELYGAFCPECAVSLLEPEDYIHILEHEITELFCARISWMDGIIDGETKPWNACGFNDIIRFAISQKHIRHQGREHIAELKYA